MQVCRSPKAEKQIDSVEVLSSTSELEYGLFHLKDTNSAENPYNVTVNVNGKTFTMEINTGTSLSLVSEQTYKYLWPEVPLQNSSVKLKIYTGTPLKVLGIMSATAYYKSQTTTLPLLVVSGIGASLIGRDWLEKLTLNWKAIHNIHSEKLQEVLSEFSEVFQSGVGMMKDFKAKIFVDPLVLPRFGKARPVPYAMKPLVEAELDRLVADGILSPVQHADWAAPIVPVMKADKRSVRICGDFKQTVNKASPLDKYPIPKIEDLFSKLAGGQKFIKLDMSQAYQHLCLDESTKYVIINTSKGLFKYNRLPFGISSAPAIFQRVMESLLQNLPHIVVYLDDILITGENNEEHLRVLAEVLNRMKQSGLRLNRTKCEFMSASVTYLGHCIDAQGLHPTSDKIDAIQKAPIPKNLTQLRAYLGLLNYYNRFLPNLSSELFPLYSLLRKATPWHWGPKQGDAFQKSKHLLLSSQLLVHFDHSKEILLCCDASNYGIGAVLAHRMNDGNEKPIGFVHLHLPKLTTHKLKKKCFHVFLAIPSFIPICMVMILH